MRALAPGFGDSVVAVDQVVTSGCDFGEQDWTRQIGRSHGCLVHALAPIVGDVSHGDGFERKVFRVRINKGQQSRDVELEYPVRICLVPLVEGTGPKCFIEFELDGRQGEFWAGEMDIV
jgi:hypothetical protein